MRPHNAAILSIALLAKQFLRLEPGQQTGNVRLGRDHHVADGRTGQPIRWRSAQNTQHVVLRRGKAKRLKPMLEIAVQGVGSPH